MDSIKIEAPKLEYACDSCNPDSQKLSQLYCKSCKIFLCKECDQSLHQMRAFKGHIKCSSNQGYLERFRSCKLHEDSSLTLYCESCNQFLCETCQKDAIHAFHQIKGVLDWDNIFPPYLSLGKKDIDSILNRIDNNINGIKKSQEKLDELFTKYFEELQMRKNLILEYYTKEIVKETGQRSFFENLKLCGPEILEDKFFIRYSHSLQKKSLFIHEKSNKFLKIAEEELQKNASWFDNLFSVNFFYSEKEFIESQFTKNNALSLSNLSKTVTKLTPENAWYPCIVQSTVNKCSFKIDKTKDSQIMIGVTNAEYLKLDPQLNARTQPSIPNLFSIDPLVTNGLFAGNTAITSLSAQLQQKNLFGHIPQINLETNIHNKISSFTYSGNGNGTLYIGNTASNSVLVNGGLGGLGNPACNTIGLNEGFKAGDIIELTYEKKSRRLIFAKNGKSIYQVLWDYLQEPWFYIQLYQLDDTVTIL